MLSIVPLVVFLTNEVCAIKADECQGANSPISKNNLERSQGNQCFTRARGGFCKLGLHLLSGGVWRGRWACTMAAGPTLPPGGKPNPDTSKRLMTSISLLVFGRPKWSPLIMSSLIFFLLHRCSKFPSLALHTSIHCTAIPEWSRLHSRALRTIIAHSLSLTAAPCLPSVAVAGYHGGRQNSPGTSQDYQATPELLQEPPPRACSKGSDCSEACGQHQKKQSITPQEVEQVSQTEPLPVPL